MTRRLSGTAVLPPDAPERIARWMLVELRDETAADQPSVLLAGARQEQVACRPGGRLPFGLEAPETAPTRRLGLRIHVDMAGGGRVMPGDLLSTQASPVPPEGDAALTVPLTLVRGA